MENWDLLCFFLFGSIIHREVGIDWIVKKRTENVWNITSSSVFFGIEKSYLHRRSEKQDRKLRPVIIVDCSIVCRMEQRDFFHWPHVVGERLSKLSKPGQSRRRMKHLNNGPRFNLYKSGNWAESQATFSLLTFASFRLWKRQNGDKRLQIIFLSNSKDKEMKTIRLDALDMQVVAKIFLQDMWWKTGNICL